MFYVNPDVAPKFDLLHRIMMSGPMQAVGAGLRGYGGAPTPAQPQQQPNFQTPPVQGYGSPMPVTPEQGKMGLLRRILQGGAAGMQGYGQDSMGARVK